MALNTSNAEQGEVPGPAPESVAALAAAEDGSVLILRGVADIFEAGALRDGALQALAAAGPVRVDLSQAERLDLSAWQVLYALGRDVRAAGRRFEADPSDAPPALARALADAGLTL